MATVNELWETFVQLREITRDDTQYPSIELYPNESGIVDFRGRMIEFGTFEEGIAEIADIVRRWRESDTAQRLADYEAVQPITPEARKLNTAMNNWMQHPSAQTYGASEDAMVQYFHASDASVTVPPDTQAVDAEGSALVHYARDELKRAGMFDHDADYSGEIGDAVMELVRVFASQEHSGGSQAATLALLEKLLRFQPLTPLTSDPDEWMDVSDASGGNPMWQSRRKPSVFSKDGGQTWYDLDDTAEVQAKIDDLEAQRTAEAHAQKAAREPDLAVELRAIDDLVREHEKAQHIGYAGSIPERLRAVVNRYDWITQQTLSAAQGQRDDVLIFLRALALVMESIGNAATHREKDARLRGGVEMLESAITRLREVEFDTRPGTHRRADIFRSDYPVRDLKNRIHELEAEYQKLARQPASNDDLPY
jgi:hypothetical protein